MKVRTCAHPEGSPNCWHCAAEKAAFLEARVGELEAALREAEPFVKYAWGYSVDKDTVLAAWNWLQARRVLEGTETARPQGGTE